MVNMSKLHLGLLIISAFVIDISVFAQGESEETIAKLKNCMGFKRFRSS